VRIKSGYASLAGAIKFTAKKKELSASGEVLNSNSSWRPLADALRTFSFENQSIIESQSSRV
jgi:hypothetical protein